MEADPQKVIAVLVSRLAQRELEIAMQAAVIQELQTKVASVDDPGV